MPSVPDASPLIALSKMERLDLLALVYGQVVLTPSVWNEAVAQGMALGARDAGALERYAQEQRFTKVRLTRSELALVNRLRAAARIGLGEAEVLAVAKSRDALAILDEKGARAIAVSLGIPHTGTAGLLFEAFLQRLVTYEELAQHLEYLGRILWVSSALLAGILRKAREVEQR